MNELRPHFASRRAEVSGPKTRACQHARIALETAARPPDQLNLRSAACKYLLSTAMSSDDEVIIISETFNNKRARTDSVPTAFNSSGGAPQVAVTASGGEGAAVTASGEFAFESLQCAICIDLLYDPCVVPCGHEFCRTCIEEVVRSTRHRGCPVCRTAFTAARLGVNRKLKTLIEQLFAKESSRRAREVAEDQERVRKEKAARDTRDAAEAHASLAARLESIAAAHSAHHSSSYDRLTHMVDGMVDGLHALRSEALLGNRSQRGEGGRRGMLSSRGPPGDLMEAMLRSRRFRSSDRLARPSGGGEAGGGEAGPGAAAPGGPASSSAAAERRAALADRIERLAVHVRPSTAPDVQQQLRSHMQRMRELSQEAIQLNLHSVQLDAQPAAAGAGDQPPSARPEPPSLHLLAPLPFSRPLSAAAGPSATAAAPEQPQARPEAAEMMAGYWRSLSAARAPMQDRSTRPSDDMEWMSRAWMSRAVPSRRTIPRSIVAEGLFADSSGPADALAAEPGGPALGSEEQEVMSARIAGDGAGALLAAAAAAGGPVADDGRGGGTRRAGASTARPSSFDHDNMPMPGYGWDDFGIPPWLEPPPPLPIARANAFSERTLPALSPRLPLDESWRTSRLVFPEGPDPRSRDGQARPASVPNTSRSAGAAREQAGEQAGLASFPRRAGSNRVHMGPGVRTELAMVEAMVAAADTALDSDPATPDLPGGDLLADEGMGLGFGEPRDAAAADAEADAWLAIPPAPALAGEGGEGWPAAAPGVAVQDRVWQAQEEERRLVEHSRVHQLQQRAMQRAQQMIRLESAGVQLRERLERHQLRTRQQQQQQQQQQGMPREHARMERFSELP